MTDNDPARDHEPTPPAEDTDGPLELEPPTPEPPRPISGARKGRKADLDAPGLLDDFDEDADFESDPEVERVVRGIPVEKTGPSGVERVKSVFNPTGEPICKSTTWKPQAIIGGVITIIAAVFAGIYADHTAWAYVLITIYWAALHTATGLGALAISTFLLGRRVGSFEGAAARLLLVVSMFLVVYSLKIPLTAGKWEEVTLAAAAYFGGLVVAFRLAPRDAAVVGAMHFGVALLLGLGGLLQHAINAGAVG